MSKELKTEVDIKSIYIKPFSSVVLEGLYVLDKQRDTLLSTPKLTVDLNKFSIFNSLKAREINFELIQLDNGSFYLKRQKDHKSNLQFILDYFNKPADTTAKKGKPWKLNFEKVAINNFHFRYKNLLRDTVIKDRVNFNDIDVTNFTTVVRNLDFKNHLFKANISRMMLREKSGFYLRSFRSNATIDTNQILLQNLLVVTKSSRIKDFFRMRFKSFENLDTDIETGVRMDADFKSSRVSSKDIEYFTSTLKGIRFDLGINGRVSGFVNDLKARNLTITGAQATYIKGNFSLKGLPDWEHTYLDLNFNQLATNKKDLDFLYSRFTGVPNRKVPEFFSKLGNVNFTGTFKGYQDNFTTAGTFKTKLGRVDPNIKIRFLKNGVPTYDGKIAATALDLGAILDDNTFGRTTFTADVNGRGDDLKTLNGDVTAKLAYFEYKGYHYNNLFVDGAVARKKFDGKVRINDRNIRLNLDGKVDFNPRLPVYNVAGTINNARLRELKFLKDTITLTAKIDADFSGDNLNNMQGHVLLSPIRVVDPRNNYVVDSVYLEAAGSGNTRRISLRSDIADGSIIGSFDLATLPSYFKTIVKKYIPSLKTKIVKPGPQNFDFSLTIKNLDPVTALFAPELKVPEQGSFNGKFNSAEKIALFNGSIKTIQYGKIIFHDFILDQSTSDDMMNANISFSKVDLSDSLYIKNISINNFLQRDSLNFNVKLSDKDATNQLDLYGLVEFGRDTTAKLKLLPSEVVLERQSWKLQEQVRIRLLNGKTEIDDFELSNGNQRVKIDGLVSANPADQLKLTFEDFSLATLNQLTKPSGIALRGTLNGDVMFTSILKQPGIEAELGIDSVYMNTTLIGGVKVRSSLDNNRKKANVSLNILNRGLETVDINGTYSLAKDAGENALDFDVRMNQTEAIIFEPFVKDLVSNLKGTLSADMRLTGALSSPKLNGTVTLANTGLTVNYLKVPYTINDKLVVENSVIKIDNLVLSDGRGGKGTADGTVDLNNLSNPTINVVLNATNLMALNTNFKDNKVYFGTAFGTGRFSFKGPVDDMKIDITASTNEGTVFNIPLNTSAVASEYDFITFKGHNDTAKVVAKERAFKGITLNFDLTVDEKTLVKIATDYGQLEGRGTARNLKLNINSLGDFEMFGDFLISSGEFEFTAKNFISKNFEVNEGGTIRWTGDPANAEINLKAIYEVRTNVANLYQAAGLQSPQGNKQVLVQAELILTKSLLQPSIDFDFTFPTDPSIKDDLGTYLTDYNNRSQQALSLIVRRNFAPGTGSNLTDQVFGTARDAVSEFAFNKLNNFISQSNIKNFDLNIRSLNDASASFRFFNDRLILNGSLFNNRGTNDLFGNNSNNLFNSNFNNLTKDFEAQYLIKADGRLRARYSYRVLNSTTLNTINDQLGIQYVNGIGLVYQRDFDTFGEFFRSLFRRGRRNANNTNQGNGTTPVLNRGNSGTDTEPDEDEK